MIFVTITKENKVMETFKKIVLNIPHSSTEKGTMFWENEERIVSKINRWTDYKTDILFSPCDSVKENVSEVIFKYSRFYVDVERLINDPLEEIGLGRIYEKFEDVNRTLIPIDERGMMLLHYERHIFNLTKEINDNTLVVDCHSFPSDLADIDICLGYNDDWSKPSDEFIEKVKGIFEDYGYKVGINEPYSNAITPCSGDYKSLMIEVNKRCYLNEDTNELKGDFYKVGNLINKVYRLALNK